MDRATRPAFVLGVSHPRSVAVIRSLGRAGVAVSGFDHRFKGTGFHSRYLAAKVHLGELDHGPRLCDFLESMPKGEGAVLFATSDPYLEFAARHHERLSRRFVVTTPPWSVLEPLMDRVPCYTLAREAGIRTPEFWAPRDAAELDDLLPRLDFDRHDYVIKTPVHDAPADVPSNRHTKAAPTPELLRERALEIASRAARFPLIERIVPGESDTCYGVHMVVGPDRRPRLVYVVKRLKLYSYGRGNRHEHPYELGANVFSETVHDPEARDAALRFVEQAGYTGTIVVEFRRDAATGELTLIKADPRVVRATGLSARIGMDVPRAVYAAFTGGSHPVARDYPDGRAWMWMSWYLRALARNRGRGVGRELLTLLRAAPRLRAFGYASLRDPRPWVADMSKLMPSRVRRRVRRMLRAWSHRKVPLRTAGLVGASRSTEPTPTPISR